jgi:hypothetical protein
MASSFSFASASLSPTTLLANNGVSTVNEKNKNGNDSSSDDEGISNKVLTSSRGGGSNGQPRRQIGYAILSGGGGKSSGSGGVAPVNNSNTAICYFYPLSGCSAGSAAYLKDSLTRKFNCRFLVVDRPGIGATSDLFPAAGSSTSTSQQQQQQHPQHSGQQSEQHFTLLHRVHCHVQDVLDVLQAEGIDHVYAYGVCIGHPYAVELCRQLLALQQSRQQASSMEAGSTRTSSQLPTIVKLHGLTLVAPFVSTSCPVSWKIARAGAAVPEWLMTSVVKSAMSMVSTVMPHVLRPSMLKRLIPPEEQEAFGWTQDDFETLSQNALKFKDESSNHAKTVEAQLGVASIWQAEVCDKFAIESGCGLVVEDENDSDHAAGCCRTNSAAQGTATTAPTTTATTMKPQQLFPIRIHASLHDKLATPASMQWIARRCYGGDDDRMPPIITWHENIHSHESMTFFGGPPHNPSLLLQAGREWCLLE